MDTLYLSYRYLCYNKARTATVVSCITLIAFLPISLDLLLDKSEQQLMSRAASTPLLVGAKGSALDLSMNSLYFGDQVPELISMKASDEIMDTGLSISVPLYVRFKDRGFPIVGTTFDYFEFRELTVEKGEMLTLLGDCVVGATAADQLGLIPGLSIVSSPESLFDLTGAYPLKMKVKDILKKTDQNITANAKLFQYTEITDKNMESFQTKGKKSIYLSFSPSGPV